jgi:hypothetical protein
MTEDSIKRKCAAIYDQVGWQKISCGVYQNAEYEVPAAGFAALTS